METETLELENTFWQFSLTVYAKTGVADECLLLQEKFNIDINVLLFCAWVGTRRNVVLALADVLAADAAVRAWRGDVVNPLRGVRQALKRIMSDDSGLRPKVKAIELEAEQFEQALLFRFARTHWPEVCTAECVDWVAANVRTFMSAFADEDVVPKKLIDAARELAK